MPQSRATNRKQLLDSAFRQDFEVNGPSLFRICQTLFNGWQHYHNHPEQRVRARFEHEARKLRTTYNCALWAMEKRLKRSNPDSIGANSQLAAGN